MTNEIGKGPQLEYIVTGLFQNQGYLTRRSIPLHYGCNNQDATDVDVLGIIFTPPFQIHKIICDCKNKQKSKPYERIFWAKGIGQFIGATDIYVSLPQASWEIVKFAQKGDVRVLTADNIHQYFIQNPNLYGMADYKFYINFFININNEMKSDKSLAQYWSTLRKLYLGIDSYVAINIIMELLLTVGKKINFLKARNKEGNCTFWKYICFESIVLLGVYILNVCSDTICLSVNAREKHIFSKLTYGDIEPSKINIILNYAKNIANEMVNAAVPTAALPNNTVVDFGEISSPPYTPNIVGLVERAIQNPEWYLNLPQVLDFILFEYGLKNKEFSKDNFKDNFNNGLIEEKLKAAKNIFAFVHKACGIDFKFLWDDYEAFMFKKNDILKTNINDDKLDNSSIIDSNKDISQIKVEGIDEVNNN